MAKNSLLKSFKYAFQGLQFAFSERNFKLHIVSTLLVISLSFYFHITKTEWITVIICIGGVLSLEIINTAIESIVDKVSPEFNQQAGKIKDLSAAAVFVFSMAALCIGLLIFIPYLF